MKKAGMVSEVELLSRRLGLAEARRDLSLAQQAAETARLQKNLLETERVSEIKLEDIERDKLLSRMNTLRGLLEDSAGDVMFIRAPYDGVVLSTPRQRSGDPVVSGEELCQIARIDAEPRARLSIPEKDYPKLRLDHSAKLYLDAFPYQRYGTIAGRLEWLSPSAVVTEAGPEFVGYIGLDRFTISAKGEPAPLSVGMSGVARVTVGKRTLIEYAFEPLRQLRENFTPASSTSPPSVDALPYVEIETGSSEPAQPEGGAQ
jgi:HlyD family secretion protein